MKKQIPMTDVACPRCLALALAGKIRLETVQRLPEGAFAPLARDRTGKCCRDCGAADALLSAQPSVPGFVAARIAVGNDRQAQYRLPNVPLGLVKAGLMAPSAPGDYDRHLEWLRTQSWWTVERAEQD